MQEERAPMQVFITNRPYMLYETVELLRAFVNGLPPSELTMEGEFCLTEQQVTEVMAAACQGLDPQDPWLRHFFLEYPILDDSGQTICLASCMAYSMFSVTMQEPDIAAQLQHVVEDWQRVRHKGYRFNSINRFGVGVDTDQGDGPVRLSAELKRLPIPEDFRLLLHETFSDMAYSAGELERILTPVACRLEQLLEPYVRRAQDLTEQWREFFRDREALLEFLRRRTGTLEQNTIDRVYITLRYFHARYSVGILSDDETVFGFHLGVGTKVTMQQAYEEGTESSLRREFAAFKLLADPGRREIIRLLNQEALTVYEVAQRLGMNSGSAFRSINSMFNAELLLRENRDGKFFYRAKLAYIQSIFDHMMAHFRGEDR